MKRSLIFIAGLAGMLTFFSFTPFEQKPRAEKTGQELFERYCKQCHGKDGTRGLFGAKNLQTSQLSDEALYTTIAKGRKVMPAWEKKLDANQLGLVVTYVKTLRK
ncbi:cytochrome c [Pseudoflavitalea sp. X16]|uniref:c-type cytochrome n=1 Tax=Paraflavitalea devenefica TaxID=2716334 RepID=UPI001421E4D2|nr:cytochrome c [Paraflavitalea devenefica]NII25955.1 cytochrome c [Paraflavitalea devenefica]